MTGTQGCGTLLAAATVGLADEVHNPKGKTLVNGTWSSMLAAGFSSPPMSGKGTTSVEGAVPIEHFNVAL